MWRGISLANKCLLLFGMAVVLIIVSALAVPWVRMTAIVDESQRELSRQLVNVWEKAVRDQAGLGPVLRSGPDEVVGDAHVTLLTLEQANERAAGDRFLQRALRVFHEEREANELHESTWLDLNTREYRYAKAVRDEERISASAAVGVPSADGDQSGSSKSRAEAPLSAGPLTGIVLLTRPSLNAGSQLAVNTAYLLSAGLIALGLALLVFYLITNKLILSPVRDLKETAELVREGNWSTRADIHTGDEFEELAEVFNQMLEAITNAQEQLRSINAQLDLKVNELSERNTSLFEANKVKGEFLANVSHELRTPLNSIIGFAELLLEIAQKEEEAGDDSTRVQKRRRYLENIHNAGKSLLEMINGLLEMAKVEAGKVDLNVEPMNVRDACEALVALIRPLADRAGVELSTDIASEIPNIETDAKKFQQIIFNLLSNAVKFTSEKAADERAMGKHSVAKVILRAERLYGRGSEGAAAENRVRFSVLDTGPGIAPEDQKRIFEKFQQLDTGHTRRHAGTGLGLAICKELTAILQGEIHLESEPGRGSVFSVLLPMHLDPVRAKEMKAELAFRNRLSPAASPSQVKIEVSGTMR
jgi:signal transduction histidine kinase